jgi:ELWxxDGT repeat protein
MKTLHHHPRRRLWSWLCIVLALLAAFTSVRPAQGTMSVRLVKDINPAGGSGLALYSELTLVGSTLFFVANDGVHGGELWISDGTEHGTKMVKDINLSGDSTPLAFTTVASTLFFVANDGVHGQQLWKSDGSATGTMLVKDITPIGDAPASLAALGSVLFFGTTDGVHGYELWKSDGSAAGTMLVKDINFFGDSSLNDLTALGDTLFFTAVDGAHGDELWKSDGTAAGTVLVKDIYPADGSSFPPNFAHHKLVVVGSVLFFVADDGMHGFELWKSDGTEADTILVKDILPGSTEQWSYPEWLTNVNGTLFFVADDGVHGMELWRSDGTEAGTTMVRDISPNNVPACSAFLVKDRSSTAPSGCPPLPPPPQVANLTAMGNTLLFYADDGVHGWELWESDGSESGTRMLKDINFGSGSSLTLGYLSELRIVGDTLLFGADDGTHGLEPWMSDGTAAGTILIQDINSGPRRSNPSEFTGIGKTLFFSADDGVHGQELWTRVDQPYAVYLPLTYR